MNYQNENKFITCVEDETRRDELGFTGIVTDMYKDKKIPNRIHLEISNRHVSRYLYDKPVFTFWIETDKNIEEVYNTVLFRIIEFNFKNNEKYNDIRDKEIIITKVYGKQELTNEVRETWSIYDNVKAQMDKLIKENNGCTEAVNVINDENMKLSDILMEKVSFPGHSYYWLDDFVFSIFCYNHKEDIIIYMKDILFMECLLNNILKEIEFYEGDNSEYNYYYMYRTIIRTIVDYMKDRYKVIGPLNQRHISMEIFRILDKFYDETPL